MEQLTVALPGRAYDIIMERGLLQQVGQQCREVLKPGCRVAVVTDSNVAIQYGSQVQESLTQAGFVAKIFLVPAGERSKSPEVLTWLWEELLGFGLTRSDAVAALGGGMVGDLAGFAAATVLRGVDFIQIPTTLLAQVDSSVGGKVAIDLKAGKNLAGAFWQPKRVLMDPDVLDSLSDEAFADGMAEVIKYGCIADRAFFHLLYHCADRAAVMSQIEEVLHTCCAIKAAIVAKDERDTGLRMLLNFGHTLGHAYEKAGNYETCTHGQAVAAGMCRAVELGVRLGMTPRELPLLLKTVARNFGLPDHIPCTMEDYQSAIGLDKKSSGSKISVILLSELGQAQAVPMEKEKLFQLIEEIEKERL